MRGAAIRAAAALTVVGLALAAGACSDDDRGDGEGDAGGNRPPRTSTTLAAATVEVFEQAGLDPRESACVGASGVDGEFTVTPGATVADPIVIETGDVRLEIPPELRTGVELERLLLGTLAASCAPASTLDRLASIDGTATDEAVIADELPPYLDARRAAGATPEELACLDAGFRAAPARLSSLAASPAAVELTCVSADRREEWRRAAVDQALAAAGASPEERACLAVSPVDQAALAAVLDGDPTATAGEVPTDGGGAPAPGGPVCGTAERLGALAVEMLADGVDPSVLAGG